MARSASVRATRLRSKPGAYFGLPNLRRNHPFALGAADLPPACPVMSQLGAYIIQRLKPCLSMLLDEEPDLLTGLAHFGRFHPAAN